MAQLLLEIFCEEIPARMQLNAAEKLRTDFENRMSDTGLYYQGLKTFVTPQRLVLTADGFSLTQEDNVTEKRGPRVDAPEKALEGFLRSTGLKKEQLTVKSTDKGDFYFAITTQKGKPTKDILKQVLEDILHNFTWPKSMRWGNSKIRWVRPIQNIACVFGGDILPVKFGHLVANDISFGHRFMSPKEFKVTDFNSYEKELKQNKVLLNHEDRRLNILWEAEKIAAKNNLKLIDDQKLLDEVTGLVEYPVVLEGEIERNFMKLPEEVLITTIKINQKYFCLRDSKGKLSNKFIFVSNIEGADGSQKIIDGNQRVLRSRLKDAEFFYAQDKNQGLTSFATNLQKIVFHNEIGTIAERVKRIETISVLLAEKLGFKKLDINLVKSAARLIKNDLSTEMVGEFPELQGVMGYYYALEQGEDAKVANAIRDQYKPQGPNDEVPEEDISVIISLSEKIEAMSSLFSAGERATGSKDPYALRRLALGIIRIIDKNELNIDLNEFIKKALKLLPSKNFKQKNRDEVLSDISEFILDRIKYQFKSEGKNLEVINAVLSRDEYLDYIDFKESITILTAFSESPEGTLTIDAYKRANNILSAEEKKEGKNFNSKHSKSLLKNQVEINLVEEIESARAKIKKFTKSGDYAHCLEALTLLPEKINNFYDNTTINADDSKVRENRLKITAAIVELFDFVAEFDSL